MLAGRMIEGSPTATLSVRVGEASSAVIWPPSGWRLACVMRRA